MHYNGNMQPTIQAVRAIAGRFALQVYVPITVIISVVVVGLIMLSVWFTTLSAWWWLLFGVVVLLGLIVGLVLLFVWVIISVVTPPQTVSVKRKVKSFVEKISHLSEVMQTPKFILLFRLVRDTLRPRKNSYIASVSNASKTLREDFEAVIEAFRQQHEETIIR